MTIIYHDDLGLVTEKVDKYGITFYDGKAHFNDKHIPLNQLDGIEED